MNKIILFNTAIGSLNMGDYIINESANSELADIVDDKDFVAEYATHSPAATSYQSFKKNARIKFADECKYKFVMGTNILAFNNFRLWPNWNLNIFNCRAYKGSVLVGVGSTPNSRKINLYTRVLYKRILSDNYIHSTRDERTKLALEEMGLRAVNTGCVTLWSLTKDKCKLIPQKKANRVIFTLTDYARDCKKDIELVNVLKKEYKEVFYWPQGADDYDYLHELGADGICVIAPRLEAYRKLLQSGDIDFVGTRLHAGIFAMQHGVRSLVLTVDNRARDMQMSYNINAIERDDIGQLSYKINSDFATNVAIDEHKINLWKSQFKSS